MLKYSWFSWNSNLIEFNSFTLFVNLNLWEIWCFLVQAQYKVLKSIIGKKHYLSIQQKCFFSMQLSFRESGHELEVVNHLSHKKVKENIKVVISVVVLNISYYLSLGDCLWYVLFFNDLHIKSLNITHILLANTQMLFYWWFLNFE